MRADVVVVGAGIAGLTAAWRLRDADVVVLEAEDRVGGRIRSEPRGPYWVSVGAHLFPGPDSVVGGLVDELGLETLEISGDLTAVAYRGRLVRGGRPETIPFRLPLSFAGRLSLIRAGLRVRRGAARYNAIARRRPDESERERRLRMHAFEDGRTFAAYLGHLHPDVEPIFRAMAERSTLTPEELSAGGGLAMFGHVWSDDADVLGRNLRGGAGALPTALAERLGERVVLGTPVEEVALAGDGVRVRTADGRELEAGSAILAVPAYAARRIVADLPPETAAALDGVVYGPFVVSGIVTNEPGAAPWDGVYAVLCADASFNMLFNHGDVLRSPGAAREPGGTLMVYGGGARARRLMGRSDNEIRDTFVADLERLFPDARGTVEEVVVQRWPLAIPSATVGRGRHQPAIEAGVGGRVFFAGDYAGEWTHMEGAAITGAEAADRARARLGVPA